MWVLVISAVLAVTKGLHFGEALFLLVIAALLRTRKREFTRRAMSLTSATTFGWYLGLVVCRARRSSRSASGAVLGDDSVRSLLFRLGEHSSRLARGLFAAALGVVIYLIWQSFAVRRPPSEVVRIAPNSNARAPSTTKHGGGEFAHLTFMGDKHLFWAADGHAVSLTAACAIASSRSARRRPDAAIDRAILDFRHFADAQDRVPVFYEVLEPDLSLYHDLGFDLFKLGELATIRSREFSLAGKRWEDLRQATNRSVKEKLSFTSSTRRSTRC